MKRSIFLLLIIFLASFTAYSQTQCPENLVCISPAAARQALVDSDTVKAQAVELAAKDQAIADLKDALNKMRIEYAEARGELTALKQNAVSDRAIIDLLLKSAKKKCLPFSVCF